MKKILKITIANVILFTVLYLMFSFYSTSFNIKEWSEGTRMATVLSYSTIGLWLNAFMWSNLD